MAKLSKEVLDALQGAIKAKLGDEFSVNKVADVTIGPDGKIQHHQILYDDADDDEDEAQHKTGRNPITDDDRAKAKAALDRALKAETLLESWDALFAMKAIQDMTLGPENKLRNHFFNDVTDAVWGVAMVQWPDWRAYAMDQFKRRGM